MKTTLKRVTTESDKETTEVPCPDDCGASVTVLRSPDGFDRGIQVLECQGPKGIQCGCVFKAYRTGHVVTVIEHGDTYEN